MTPVERKIADRFDQIADCGWFPDRVSESSAQLRVFREVLAPSQGKMILDAGCARGRFLKAAEQTGAKLFGIDLTESFARDAAQNVPSARFACGSLTALPYGDGTFDGILCVEALEHVPDTEAAIREFARVLRTGGKLLIIDKSLRGLHPGTGLPNIFWKWREESKGRWMYPEGFPFREKWFWPNELATLLRRSFGNVEIGYVSEPDARSAPLVRLFPTLAFQAAWTARK